MHQNITRGLWHPGAQNTIVETTHTGAKSSHFLTDLRGGISGGHIWHFAFYGMDLYGYVIVAYSTIFLYFSVLYVFLLKCYMKNSFSECGSALRNFAPRAQVTEIILLSAKAGTHLLGQVTGSHSSTP